MGGQAITASVSREARTSLDCYLELLRKWNKAVNLVSGATLEAAWNRHIEDSLQLWRHFPPAARVFADLGSGGGLPGIPLAIMARAEGRPMRCVLVESDQRKAAFLSQASRDLGLDIEVRTERIESTAILNADVLAARALAPLEKLLGFAQRHLATGGRAIFPKGARAEEEMSAARARWRFTVVSWPSTTDPNAQVLVFTDICDAG